MSALVRDGGIPIEEWTRAVASVPNVRLDDSPMTATNPMTGETVTVDGRDGDAAVLLDGEWVKVFHFFEGRVRFEAGELDDPNDPIARAAFSLARILSVRVIGADGNEHVGS